MENKPIVGNVLVATRDIKATEIILGTIQILRNQEGWLGGVGQMIMQ